MSSAPKRGRPADPTAKRPRILLIAPQPFYEDRGTPIAVSRVIQAFVELGGEVDLLTYPVGRNVSLPGLRIFRVASPIRIQHVPIGFSLKKVALDLLLIPRLVSQLRRERYTCIHAVEESAFLATFFARRYGIPVIYDMQSSLPQQLVKQRIFRGRLAQAWLRRLERWLIRRVDVVVCSAGLEERVLDADPGAIVMQWYFPSTSAAVPIEEIRSLREDLRLPDASPIVLYAGNLEPYQGIPLLLDSMELVHDQVPEAVFVIVGANEASDSIIRERARELEHRGILRLVTRQPRDAMPRFLAMADVVVSPRGYGGNLPLKIFDYMAGGKPIVATDSPVHRAVLDPGRALLVDPVPADFARGICTLLQDPIRARDLGEAARRYAEANFSWTAFVEQIRELYARAGIVIGQDVTA